MPGLSVLVPVYNEQESILLILEQLHRILTTSNLQFEVIIINDGSTDLSASRLRGSIYPHIYIEHALNKGYGAALKTGLKAANYPIIVILDGDETYPLERIPDFYKLMGNYKMVVGERNFKILPYWQKLGRSIVNWYAGLLAGERIPDLNSGFRMFYRDEAKKNIPYLPDGFSFTSTITMIYFLQNHPVHYFPIDYRLRNGTSKMNPVRNLFHFLLLITRISTKLRPAKILVPTGFTFFIIGIVLVLFANKPWSGLTPGFLLLGTGIVFTIFGSKSSWLSKHE
jgi:glycosyltransferase involved in cell wall biosynthesis